MNIVSASNLFYGRLGYPVENTPLAHVHWRYQWLWLYGFVHPESGETYFWILPRANITLFNQVLADFAREFQAGKNKQIILTLDQAGWHTSEQVQIPEGIPPRIYAFSLAGIATCREIVAPG